MEHNDTIDLQANTHKDQIEKKPIERAKKRHKATGLAWFDDQQQITKGETSMWVAVITQAMMDALNRATNAETRYHKDEAIRWLTGNSKDFVHVCLLSGLDPDYVRRKSKKAIASGVSWRAAPGKGKRYLERKAKRNKASREEKPKENTNSTNNVIIGPWKATCTAGDNR